MTRLIELRVDFEAQIEFYKKERFFYEEILIDLRYESLSLIVQPAIDQSTNPSVEGRGHRVVEERISTSTIDLEEDSSVATYSTAWPSTMETDIMDNEILIGTVDYKSTLEVTTAATLTNEVMICTIIQETKAFWANLSIKLQLVKNFQISGKYVNI